MAKDGRIIEAAPIARRACREHGWDEQAVIDYYVEQRAAVVIRMPEREVR